MKKITVENTFRWLLAAWMLMATSVTSSAYVHGHGGGNLSHEHDEHDLKSFPQSSTPSTFHYHDESDSMSLSPMDVHHHGCLVLLGTITYPSMPDKSPRSQEKQPCGWEMIVAVSATQSARVLVKGVKRFAVDYSGLSSLAVLSTGCACEPKPLGSSCAGAAPSFPLCDRARHERSGVLLA